VLDQLRPATVDEEPAKPSTSRIARSAVPSNTAPASIVIDPTVKSGRRVAPFYRCSFEQFRATLCLHRSTSLGTEKSLWHDNFRKSRRPDAFR
jgi:hypothetical protein